MSEADKYLNTVEIIWNMNHSEKPKDIYIRGEIIGKRIRNMIRH